MDKSANETPPQTDPAGLTVTPYFASPDQLPAPLPTEAELQRSTDVLKTGLGRRIVRVGQHYVVKYGRAVSLIEGENMLWLRETCPDMAVPRVYALYQDTDEDGYSVVHIVMERIDGEPLVSRWDAMDKEAKSDVSRRMRSLLKTMRSIPSPGYYGCIGRRPLEDAMFWTSDQDTYRSRLAGNEPINGPFDSEAQLNRALVNKYRLLGGKPAKASFYDRIVPRVLFNHAPVFTHGDLQAKNAVVRRDGSLVLVDWEAAGWYPSYWEYAYAMVACGRWNDDWSEHVADMLGEEHPTEYLWFDLFMREIWSWRAGLHDDSSGRPGPFPGIGASYCLYLLFRLFCSSAYSAPSLSPDSHGPSPADPSSPFPFLSAASSQTQSAAPSSASARKTPPLRKTSTVSAVHS